MELTDFKKGSLVRITKRPSMWSSRYSNLDLRDRIQYPFESTIENISDDFRHCRISRGGWALDYLVRENCIELITSREMEPLFIN